MQYIIRRKLTGSVWSITNGGMWTWRERDYAVYPSFGEAIAAFIQLSWIDQLASTVEPYTRQSNGTH